MRIALFFLLLVACVLSACSNSTESPTTENVYGEVAALTGDVARGELLFNAEVAPPCSACHVPSSPASPPLDGFGEIAASRVEGMSAHEYAYYSIVEPGRFIVEGYGNVMYNQYGANLEP
jgi:hypothetical protein